VKFKVTPLNHQLEVIEKTRRHNHYALFWEVGTGKTYGVINIARAKYYEALRLKRTIVLAPISTLYGWKNEWVKFSTIPENKIDVITSSGKKRISQLESALFDTETKQAKDKIIIINYEALVNTEVLDLIMEWSPEVMICDESHLLKSGKARRTKACIKISDEVRSNSGNVFLLTGTPILNSPIDIFWQFVILDGGDTFTRNFIAFRQKYFIDKNGAFAGKKGYWPKWEIQEKKMPELTELIYDKASRVTKDICLDLPPLVKEIRHSELGPQQKKLYKEMEKEFITFLKVQDEITPIVAEFAMTKALRLLQICSGFVKDADGREFVLEKVPKLEILKELLEDITPDHKVIVWCSFIQNYKMIAQLCSKLKIKSVMLTGQQSTKEKQEAIDSFQMDQDVRVMIANRKAGGTGITLTAASYSIIYSRDVSLANEIQSEARNYRKGSEVHEKVTKIDLITPDTVEEKVLHALTTKQKISDVIIDAYKE
jgi:SNF2 family DNA or RNA helicase